MLKTLAKHHLPQFAKIDVFGENQIPLYKWLEENSKFEGFSGFMGMIVSAAAKKNDKDYKNYGWL